MRLKSSSSLNRTFYGIETTRRTGGDKDHQVLIVPFMELKPGGGEGDSEYLRGLNRTFYGIETLRCHAARSFLFRLNRTFYGIETEDQRPNRQQYLVLIVPFMELKRRGESAAACRYRVLIVRLRLSSWKSLHGIRRFQFHKRYD